MKIFISGPMTGYENWNFPAFNEAAERFHEAGYQVINPAKFYESIDMTPIQWEEAMRQAIKLMVDCDAIAMLPGWRKSKGARIEAAIAYQLGFKFFDAETMETHEFENVTIVIV
jgi:hypothetical protein